MEENQRTPSVCEVPKFQDTEEAISDHFTRSMGKKAGSMKFLQICPIPKKHSSEAEGIQICLWRGSISELPGQMVADFARRRAG